VLPVSPLLFGVLLFAAPAAATEYCGDFLTTANSTSGQVTGDLRYDYHPGFDSGYPGQIPDHTTATSRSRLALPTAEEEEARTPRRSASPGPGQMTQNRRPAPRVARLFFFDRCGEPAEPASDPAPTATAAPAVDLTTMRFDLTVLSDPPGALVDLDGRLHRQGRRYRSTDSRPAFPRRMPRTTSRKGNT